MWKVLLGIVLAVLGVVAFFIGLQYASFAMPTDVDAVLRERYKYYSSIFGYLSYALFVAGVVMTIWAVRQQNKRS